MTSFTLFLRWYLDRMRSLLRERVPMRIAVHRYPGVRGLVEAAEEFCARRPVSKSSTCGSPRSGCRPTICTSCRSTAARCRSRSLWLRSTRRGLLVALYHSDHRELCAHERGRSAS
jgi:hypothetical protein